MILGFIRSVETPSPSHPMGFNMGFWVYGNLTLVTMLSYEKIGLYFNMGNANPIGAKPYGELTWDSGSMGV